MEQLIQENQKTLKQINVLSDSVALNQKIDEIKDTALLHKIIKAIQETDELINSTNKLLKRDLIIARKEYDEVMRDLRQTQADIVNYLVKIKKKKVAEEEILKTPHAKAAFVLSHFNHTSHSTLPKSVQKMVLNSGLKQVQLKFGNLAVTPKMSIEDYKKSPLVKKLKLRAVPIDLLDFDVRITGQQFNSIPQYMRGRTSHDELQYFFENTVVSCFNEKYKLLYRTRAAVQHTKDFEIWKIYHSQISYVPGRHFITAGDISRKMQRMIDKKIQNLLVMIRHLGILQEQRISQTICYIWTATA